MIKRRSCLIIFGIIGLLVCIVLAVAVYFVQKEQAEIRDKYGKDVANLCDTPGGGVASLDNLTNTDGSLQFLILTDAGLYHAWQDKLPTTLRAADRAALDIVVCLEEYTTLVESCPYTDDKDEVIFTIERQKSLLDVIMLSPDGQRIYETTLSGGAPDKCPAEARKTEGSTSTLNGTGISYNDFYIELEKFVAAQR